MTQNPASMTLTLSQDDLKGIDQMLSGEMEPTSIIHQWESNPDSWKTPEQCPWGNMAEDFNQEFDQVPTMLDQILFRHRQMSEAFEDAMMNNLWFKRGTMSPDFPSKFTHEEFKGATDWAKQQTLKAMDKISQEVAKHLELEGLPLTNDGTVPDLRLYKAPAVNQ